MERLGTDKIIEINGQSITVYDSPHTTDNMVYAVQINNKTYYTNIDGYNIANGYTQPSTNQVPYVGRLTLSNGSEIQASTTYNQDGNNTNVYAVKDANGNTYYTDYEGYLKSHNLFVNTEPVKPETKVITLSNGEQIVANTTYNQTGDNKNVYAVKGTDGKTYYTDYNGYKTNNNLETTKEPNPTAGWGIDNQRYSTQGYGSERKVPEKVGETTEAAIYTEEKPQPKPEPEPNPTAGWETDNQHYSTQGYGSERKLIEPEEETGNFPHEIKTEGLLETEEREKPGVPQEYKDKALLSQEQKETKGWETDNQGYSTMGYGSERKLIEPEEETGNFSHEIKTEGLLETEEREKPGVPQEYKDKALLSQEQKETKGWGTDNQHYSTQGYGSERKVPEKVGETTEEQTAPQYHYVPGSGDTFVVKDEEGNTIRVFMSEEEAQKWINDEEAKAYQNPDLDKTEPDDESLSTSTEEYEGAEYHQLGESGIQYSTKKDEIYDTEIILADGTKIYVQKNQYEEILKSLNESALTIESKEIKEIESFDNFVETEDLTEEEIPESAYGDFMADMLSLISAYDSVLDMRIGIKPCIDSLEYQKPSFPGESLGGRECSIAKISKPDYNAITTSISSAKSVATEISSKIDELADIVNNQIETFKTEQSEATELLDYFLMTVATEKLSNYMGEELMNIAIENADILPPEYVYSLLGQMNEQQLEKLLGNMSDDVYYDEFIPGVESYYAKYIDGLGEMQKTNAEVLSIINLFLNNDEFVLGLKNQELLIQNDINNLIQNTGLWTSYEDAANTGYSGVMTETEYKRRNPNGDYETYLQQEQRKLLAETTSSYKGLQEYFKLIDEKIRNNTELQEYGITSYDQLLEVKETEEYKESALREAIINFTNIKNSAKYNYLAFTKNYADYDESTFKGYDFLKNIGNDYYGLADIFDDMTADRLIVALSSKNAEDLKILWEVHPEISENLEQYGIKSSEELLQIIDDKELFDVSVYDSSFMRTYGYLYNQDPTKAHDYKEVIQYKINNIEGQIKANEYLSKWLIESKSYSSEEFKQSGDYAKFLIESGLFNTASVAVEGLIDGTISFTEGLKYAAEAALKIEGRTRSAEEYKRMYILQALLSENDKEKMGLIQKDELGNYINNPEVNPYNIIDYTKHHVGDGVLLSSSYKLNQGIGNMLPSILLSTILCPLAGSISLGVSSGGNAYHNAMVEGNSYERSLFYGILTGSTEAITERYLGGLPGLSETKVVDAKSWVLAALKEGNEEVYQDLMDIAFKAIATGEKIELPNSAEELAEFAGSLAETWAMGAITAGIMQSPSLVNILISDPNIINSKDMTNFLKENSELAEKIEQIRNQNNQQKMEFNAQQMKQEINDIAKLVANNIPSSVSEEQGKTFIARTLYIELAKRLHYDSDYYFEKDKTGRPTEKAVEIYNEKLSFENLDNPYVICKGWSELYMELLLENGFTAEQVKMLGRNNNGTSHKWVEIKLSDRTIIADATEAPIKSIDANGNKRYYNTDLYNTKNGSAVTGFIEFNHAEMEEFEKNGKRLSSYKEVQQVKDKINQYIDFDTWLGYATDSKYMDELVNEAEALFRTTNSNSLSTLDFLAQQDISRYDGMEAYKYFQNIVRHDNSVKLTRSDTIINNHHYFTAILEDSTGKKITYNSFEGLQVFD